MIVEASASAVASEVTAEVSKEVAKEAVKEAAKEATKEFGNKVAEKAVDIGKRIDTSKASEQVATNKPDITKRVPVTSEISNNDISSTIKDYVDDLKSKSICPETISSNTLNPDKLELQSPDKVAELREEFDYNKSKLRHEWEILNGREWPRYTEEYLKENGIINRKPGDCFDAHHIQPLQLGGANEASNLTPLDILSHKEVHMKNGSCDKLVDAVKGAD